VYITKSTHNEVFELFYKLDIRRYC